MKGGKDVGRENEKPMDPLFPRLHINDADKGGLRAPPRNKMALYEQLSVPSHRFGSPRPSAPILLRSDAGHSPSGSSGQGVGHDRSIFTSPSVQRTPAFSTGKVHSWSSNGLNTNVASSSRESKLAKYISSKSSNITSHLPEAARSTFHPHVVSKTRDVGGRKPRGEDDCAAFCANKGMASRLNEKRVTLKNPAFSGHCTSNMPSTSKMHVVRGCYSQLNIAEGKLAKESNGDHKSRHSGVSAVGHGKCLAEGKANKMMQVVGPIKKIRSSSNADSMDSEHIRHMKSMPKQAFLNGSRKDVSNVCEFRRFIHQGSTVGLPSDEKRHSGQVSTRDRWNTDADEMNREAFLRLRSKFRSGELAKKTNECSIKSKSSRNMLPDDRNRADDVSETSMMDSNSSLEVSPDDVVGVIGPKQFWKARRVILNQQRIFSVQVFELHRLIKVQKFLAGSPELLLDEDLMTPLGKIAGGKVLPDDNYESVPLEPTTKQKDGLPIPSETIKCLSDNLEKPALSINNILNKGSGGQEPSHGCSDARTSQGPITTDSRNTTWCFPSLGSQWLVPVMSPSEGLIYMPVTGPCSPTAGFLTPVYSACSPLSLPAVGGNIAKPAYGLLPSHHQGGVAILSSAPNYFPQGLHVVNPIMSNPNAGEQDSTPSGSRVSVQAEFSTADVNKNMHSRGSCNGSNQKADAFSSRVWTFQASKNSDFHGSAASISSNHCEKVQEAAGHASKGRDSLDLFPLTSAMEEKSNQEHEQSNEHHQSQVIKVVPHNARSASESAARIFQSIQKERQPYDCS